MRLDLGLAKRALETAQSRDAPGAIFGAPDDQISFYGPLHKLWGQPYRARTIQ